MNNTVAYNSISDLCPVGIVFVNGTGTIKYVNAEFSNITGYPSKEIIGINENVLNTRLRDLCEKNYRGLFDIRYIEDCATIQLDKPVRRLVSYTSRVITKAGKFQGKIYYFHDITREQEAEERIQSDFLSVAAHKLRTPLVGILGFSELLLKRKFDSAKQAEIIATIFRQATNFKQMFDDFLDIERLDIRKGRNFSIVEGTLEKLLPDVLDENSDFSGRVKVIYETPDIWPKVNFDSDKIKQVLSNLISNAVKYSPEGGEVVCNTVVRSDNGNDEFGVRIIDHGIGIAPSDLLHVGERFYRAAESQSVPGSGLGIALVESIMAIHNGRFELTSTKGKGTTAIAWFPVT